MVTPSVSWTGSPGLPSFVWHCGVHLLLSTGQRSSKRGSNLKFHCRLHTCESLFYTHPSDLPPTMQQFSNQFRCPHSGVCPLTWTVGVENGGVVYGHISTHPPNLSEQTGAAKIGTSRALSSPFNLCVNWEEVPRVSNVWRRISDVVRVDWGGQSGRPGTGVPSARAFQEQVFRRSALEHSQGSLIERDHTHTHTRTKGYW